MSWLVEHIFSAMKLVDTRTVHITVALTNLMQIFTPKVVISRWVTISFAFAQVTKAPTVGIGRFHVALTVTEDRLIEKILLPFQFQHLTFGWYEIKNLVEGFLVSESPLDEKHGKIEEDHVAEERT